MRKQFSLLFFIPIAAMAQNQTPDQFDQRLTALEKQVQNKTLYNAPARSEVVDGYNFFLTGDFLYWKAEENGLTYAFKVKHPENDLFNNHLHLKDPHFEWDYGFRVGAGWNIPHDHWDLYLNWTHFYTGAQGHVHANQDEGIFPVWAAPFGPLGNHFVLRSKAFWKLYLNILDAELGKEYYVGKKLSLRPHLDIRTVWIDQHFTVDYEDPDLNDRVEMKQNYWGIGPRVGLDLQWWLCWGLSICGNADISLVYGKIRSHQEEEMVGVPGHLHYNQHLHITRAITDLGLYLAWDHMFYHDQYHFGLKAGWEEHLFFGQNQLFRFLDPFFNGSIVSNQGDLALQGWTFSARIDF